MKASKLMISETKVRKGKLAKLRREEGKAQGN